MRFDVVTLFPEMFRAMLGVGVTGRAFERSLAKLALWNPRDYTQDVHRTVDDRPYGGGPGMVMKVAPLLAAIEDAKAAAPGAVVAYLSPQGVPFDQRAAERIARRDGMILVAGRYEGIDERLIGRCVDEEWSIGDYVLSGGELPCAAQFVCPFPWPAVAVKIRTEGETAGDHVCPARVSESGYALIGDQLTTRGQLASTHYNVSVVM